MLESGDGGQHGLAANFGLGDLPVLARQAREGRRCRAAGQRRVEVATLLDLQQPCAERRGADWLYGESEAGRNRRMVAVGDCAVDHHAFCQASALLAISSRVMSWW